MLNGPLQRLVQDPLAGKILRGEFKPGDHIVVDEGNSETLDFRKAAASAVAGAPVAKWAAGR